MSQTLKMPPVIHSVALRIMAVRYQVGLLVFINGYDRVNRIQSKPEHALEPKEILQVRNAFRASLVAQWLRICLLMQETRVRALVWEDPTCQGATGPVSHNY